MMAFNVDKALHGMVLHRYSVSPRGIVYVLDTSKG
jgi:hypothetical protein